ncbi:hypothetical protein DAPK24_042690 [Pichia kluyveri]|uniref:B30.2/SPRY domain-containing protein n=1 Tax=Pichia kluyveri TaxID=36015 RepID=A0AAV5R811_PICKL|nr:hypothetical protein DAPK24_042690 [Pichia kluyveri]
MNTIPTYLSFQYINNHLEDEIKRNNQHILPDTIRWRKILQLSTNGYLGKNPCKFLKNSNDIKNNQYLNNLLNLNIDEVIDDNKDNDHESFKNLSIPYKFDKIKSDLDFIIDYELNTISTKLLDNPSFNIYPRLNNEKSGYLTVPFNSIVSPLVCIYYYELKIIDGKDNGIDLVLGFLKDEIKNINRNHHHNTNNNTNSSINTMIDMRGNDDRIVGWNGKTGNFTIWDPNKKNCEICKFGKNDIIGIGYNLFKDLIFLTKNGLLIKEIGSIDKWFEKSFEGKKNIKGLIPIISLGSWCNVEINFGINGKDKEFEFDIENYVKLNKFQLQEDIINKFEFEPFNVSKDVIIKNNNNIDMIKYTDSLVLEYLKYGGYLNTLKGMENDMQKLNRESIVISTLEEPEGLCYLKKQIREMIQLNKFNEVKKLLECQYNSFFITYRKINFRLRIVSLIYEMITGMEINECIKRINQISEMFKEDECQNYIEQVSIIFSYDDYNKCPKFNEFFNGNKNKLIYAIIIALNEQNELPFFSFLDMLIMNCDSNLQDIVIDWNDKGSLLINILEDYIKYV